MTLAETLLRQIENPTLTYDERTQLRCQVAADFEHRGQYEAALDALIGLWQGIGQRPLALLGIEHVLLVYANPGQPAALLGYPLAELGVLGLELGKVGPGRLPLLARSDLLISHGDLL